VNYYGFTSTYFDKFFISRPKMYEPVEFQLISTSHVPFLVFQLFSKGIMKMSRVVQLENGYANLTILPKFSYTPKAHCIVFFINESGEIVTDSITLYFENVLPNYVNIIFYTLCDGCSRQTLTF
jgi:Alpha-2-macroglobulin bait region domain